MGQVQFFNFQVATRDIEGLTDARGESIKAMLKSDYSILVNSVRVILGYQVKSNISEKEAERAIYDLFADPIIEFGALNQSLIDNKKLFPKSPEIAITVGFKPGVTDNAGQAGLDGLTTLFPEVTEVTKFTEVGGIVGGEVQPCGGGSLWISLIKRVLGVRVVAEGLRRMQLDKKSLT